MSFIWIQILLIRSISYSFISREVLRLSERLFRIKKVISTKEHMHFNVPSSQNLNIKALTIHLFVFTTKNFVDDANP